MATESTMLSLKPHALEKVRNIRPVFIKIIAGNMV